MGHVDEKEARKRISFSMSLGYERSSIMKDGLDHMALMGRVRDAFFARFVPSVHEAWLNEDVQVTAGLRTLIEGAGGPGHASLLAHAEPWVQPVIRAMSLAAFKKADPAFDALIERVNKRLEPLELAARQAEFVGCTSCGDNCWKFDMRFSVEGVSSGELCTIEVMEPQTQGGPKVLAEVPVIVFVSFTCSHVDYEKLLRP